MKITRYLTTTCLLFSLACGDDDGGASDGVTVPGDETAAFNTLSTDEMTGICEAINADKKSIVMNNPEAVCLTIGMGQAFDAMAANGEKLPEYDWAAGVAVCEEIQAECIGMVSALSAEVIDDCTEKAAEWAYCTATIGEIQACLNALIAKTHYVISVRSEESCASKLSVEGMSGPSLDDNPEFQAACGNLPLACNF